MEAANNKIQTGLLAGTVTAVKMPNVYGNYCRFKARNGNTGNVYIGPSTITIPNNQAVTDVTSGFELAPGDDTGWIPTANIAHFYYMCDNATDVLTYIVISNITS